VITAAEFTKPAREFANRTRTKMWRVRLVDHRVLKRLLECKEPNGPDARIVSDGRQVPEGAKQAPSGFHPNRNC
jgi:hypothetical protein